jgi:hypothetical protein
LFSIKITEIMADHLLVFWEKDKKFSVVRRSRVCDEKIQDFSDEAIRNVRTSVMWKGKTNRGAHPAMIIEAGQKKNLVLPFD